MKKILLLIGLVLLSLPACSQPENAGENTDKIEARIFPNPATNVINVLGLQNSAKAEIIISDVYGNVVLQHRWEIKNNALNIPIAGLATGIYIIHIRSKEQQVRTKFYKK